MLQHHSGKKILLSSLSEQLRKLRHVGRDPPRLIFTQQLAAYRRSDRRLGCSSKIEIAKGLPVGVAHDKAGGLFFDAPRRREPTGGHGFGIKDLLSLPTPIPLRALGLPFPPLPSRYQVQSIRGGAYVDIDQCATFDPLLAFKYGGGRIDVMRV
jgi:hypothetical protein